MPTKLKFDAGALLAKHLRSLALGKKSYKQADAAMDELEKQLDPGEVVLIESGRLAGKRFRFVDKFAGKNRISVGQSARRFEFEEVTNL